MGLRQLLALREQSGTKKMNAEGTMEPRSSRQALS
jgi:hypothetical protein